MARRRGNDGSILLFMFTFFGIAGFIAVLALLAIVVRVMIGKVNADLWEVLKLLLALIAINVLAGLEMLRRYRRNQRIDRKNREQCQKKNREQAFAQSLEAKRQKYMASVSNLPQPPVLKLWNDSSKQLLDTRQELVIVREGDAFSILPKEATRKKALVQIWFSPYSHLLTISRLDRSAEITINGEPIPIDNAYAFPSEQICMGDLKLTVC